jgi:hypothetical protein
MNLPLRPSPFILHPSSFILHPSSFTVHPSQFILPGMPLSLLYRGPLSSCNYDCRYCPFAKRTENRSQLEKDAAALVRFTDWLATETAHRWRILFTPWGEALVRRWYREAITQISWLPHVESVAVQTNLSCSLDWIANCQRERLAFWATFHPTQVDRASFVAKVRQLYAQRVRMSVGVVGVPEFRDEIAALRQELPADVYVWVNAQQPRPRPYSEKELAFFSAIDSRFELTVHKHRSLGQACRTGESVFTLDGRGDMRRCHFVDDVIGNIYHTNWPSALQPRTCSRQFCQCFLGLSHLDPLQLDDEFGVNVLARIPAP